MMEHRELAEAYVEVIEACLRRPELIARLLGLCRRARDEGEAAWERFFQGRIQQEREQHQDALAQFERALRLDRDHVFAFFSRGASLDALGRTEEEMRVYDEVVSRFGASEEVVVQERVGAALVNKGVVLHRLGRFGDAIGAFDEAVSRLGSSEAPLLLVRVGVSLFNKGNVLRDLGRLDDAISAFTDAVLRLSSLVELFALELVAKCLVNKGNVLGRVRRFNDAIAAYDQVASRFGESEEPPLREQVALALFNTGVSLEALGRFDDAIRAYDQAISRAGESTEDASKELLVQALAYKAQVLGRQGRKKEALRCLEEGERRDSGSFFVRQTRALLLDRDDKAKPADKAAARRSAVAVAGDDHRKQIETYLRFVIERFGDKKEEYFEKMKQRQGRVERFLEPKGAFHGDQSVLMVLREWNSYTPAIPDESEADRGGGYFVWHRGQGIVIDPGFDFLVNFQQAGGRIHDVDHVIVTHAHNDHTADLESVLNLLFNYNKQREREDRPDLRKRVKLYLGAGAQRKFSGLIPLRDVDYIDQIVTLNPARKDRPQVIPLFTGATLTVLPAYHDDVVTPDTAVGLAFDFRFRGKDTPTRRVVFTADTGLYPRRRDKHGDYLRDDDAVDAREEVALYRCYPNRFAEPGKTDLLVAHIGSIRQEEFREDLTAWDPQQEPTFYQDHLGLLGTLILLDQLAPRAAIVSEFGEELKDIKVALVDEIDKALANRREDQDKTPFRVFPGDLTTVYDIKQAKFLCHNTHQFEAPEDLVIKQGAEYDVQGQARPGVSRPYLLTQEALQGVDLPEDALRAYFRKRAEGTLPYFASNPDPAGGAEPT